MSAQPQLNPPQQARSRQTLQRIVHAFERALQERNFEEITVGEICRRARCSVGTFYGRVESKERLLELLRDRVYVEAQAVLRQLFDPQVAASMALPQVLRAHAEGIVDLHLQWRGVIRALVVQARRRAEFAAYTLPFNEAMLRTIGAAWLVHRDRIDHADADLAVERAIIMAAGYMREAIVFAHLWPTQQPVDRQIHVDELERLITTYLTGRAPAAAHRTEEIE